MKNETVVIAHSAQFKGQMIEQGEKVCQKAKTPNENKRFKSLSVLITLVRYAATRKRNIHDKN